MLTSSNTKKKSLCVDVSAFWFFISMYSFSNRKNNTTDLHITFINRRYHLYYYFLKKISLFHLLVNALGMALNKRKKYCRKKCIQYISLNCSRSNWSKRPDRCFFFLKMNLTVFFILSILHIFFWNVFSMICIVTTLTHIYLE